MTYFEKYDSKEEAYKAGYQNGKLIGTLQAAQHMADTLIEKLEANKDGD